MILRPLSFVLGVAAGIYGSIKARRLAYRLSIPGVSDQIAAARLGLSELRDELRTGMDAKQDELRGQLDAPPPPKMIEKDTH